MGGSKTERTPLTNDAKLEGGGTFESPASPQRDHDHDGTTEPFSPKTHVHGFFAKGGEFGATMTLSVSTIGAGVLALPSAFSQAGIATSILTIFFIGYLTVLTIRYIVRSMIVLKVESYDAISQQLLGVTAEHFSRALVVFYNLGASVGYIIIMGNVLEPFRPELAAWTTEMWVTVPKFPQFIYWLLVLLPLCCVREIKSFQDSSTVAIAAAAYTSLMVCYRYFVPGPGQFVPSTHADNGIVYGFSFTLNCMIALTVMMFAFDCQVMVFQIYTNLRHPSLPAITRVATGNVLVSGFVYGAVGIFGYLSFGNHVADDILSNYNPKRDMLALVAYVGYSVPITIAYILFMFPTRDAFFAAVLGTEIGERVEGKYFYPTSILMSVLTVVLALYIPSIMIVFALLGGLCGSLLCYIFPAAFALRLHYKGLERVSPVFLAQQWFVFAFGVFTCFIGTYASVRHVLATGQG